MVADDVGKALVEEGGFVDDVGADGGVVGDDFFKVEGVSDFSDVGAALDVATAKGHGVFGVVLKAVLVDLAADEEDLTAVDFVGKFGGERANWSASKRVSKRVSSSASKGFDFVAFFHGYSGVAPHFGCKLCLARAHGAN